MKKILKFLFILQEVSNEQRHKDGLKRLGRGYFKAHRINPYNPVSYPFVLIVFIIGIVLFGVVGVWREIDCRNPFKWD